MLDDMSAAVALLMRYLLCKPVLVHEISLVVAKRKCEDQRDYRMRLTPEVTCVACIWLALISELS